MFSLRVLDHKCKIVLLKGVAWIFNLLGFYGCKVWKEKVLMESLMSVKQYPSYPSVKDAM